MALHKVQPSNLRMDKPLVVAAGRPLDDVFAGWRDQAWRFALVYLLAFSAAGVALRLMHRRQNEARDQAQLLEAGQRRQQRRCAGWWKACPACCTNTSWSLTAQPLPLRQPRRDRYLWLCPRAVAA
jgi:hypothetical protein